MHGKIRLKYIEKEREYRERPICPNCNQRTISKIIFTGDIWGLKTGNWRMFCVYCWGYFDAPEEYQFRYENNLDRRDIIKEIICPFCLKHNKFDIRENMNCSYCNTNLRGLIENEE